MFFFYSPEKGFLRFSGRLEMEHWVRMGLAIITQKKRVDILLLDVLLYESGETERKPMVGNVSR